MTHQRSADPALKAPIDTAISVRSLCRTHVDLRRMRYGEIKGIPYLSKTPQGSTVHDTLKVLEAEIERLMETLPTKERISLVGPIAGTHAASLKRLIPQVGEDISYVAHTKEILFAVASGVDALRMELDLGMYPSLEGFNATFCAVIEQCKDPEAEDWRLEAKRLFERQQHGLCNTLLWYMREACSDNRSLKDDLSVFLAELLRKDVQRHPRFATDMCKSAALKSETYNVAALILAGLHPVVDEVIKTQGKPDAVALLEKCASQHGRIAFIRDHVSLEHFLKTQSPLLYEAPT